VDVYAVATFEISYLVVSLLVRMPFMLPLKPLPLYLFFFLVINFLFRYKLKWTPTTFISIYTNYYYRGQFIDL